MLKIEKLAPRINMEVKLHSKRIGLDSNVILAVIKNYASIDGFVQGAIKKEYSPSWFEHYTGNYVEEYWRASKLNRRAAYLSTSWGLGGIMGRDYKEAGYVDVYAMIAMFEQSEKEQLKGLLNVIVANKRLYEALKKQNWAKVAYHYNGIGYNDVGNAEVLQTIFNELNS